MMADADGLGGPSVNADEHDVLGYGSMVLLGRARNAGQRQKKGKNGFHMVN